MREQFPPEIEAVRRTLYPVANKARENEENKVRLVRDRLYINNVEYKQTNTTKTESMKPRKQNDYTKHSQQRTNENFSQPHARIFKSRNIRRANNGGPVHLDFTTPNRFSVFNARQNDNETVSSPAGNRKQKASSPLENDQNVKKLRDNVSATHRSPWTLLHSDLFYNNSQQSLRKSRTVNMCHVTIPPLGMQTKVSRTRKAWGTTGKATIRHMIM